MRIGGLPAYPHKRLFNLALLIGLGCFAGVLAGRCQLVPAPDDFLLQLGFPVQHALVGGCPNAVDQQFAGTD